MFAYEIALRLENYIWYFDFFRYRVLECRVRQYKKENKFIKIFLCLVFASKFLTTEKEDCGNGFLMYIFCIYEFLPQSENSFLMRQYKMLECSAKIIKNNATDYKLPTTVLHIHLRYFYSKP